MSDGLWERLCVMPRPHKVVDFPRRDSNGELIKDVQLAVWVLTQGEQEEAAARAEQRARELLKPPKDAPPLTLTEIRSSDVYRNCAADELLFRACRSKDLKSAFFPTATLLRQFLTVDEVGVLCQIYYGVQDDLGPLVTTMTDHDREALLDQLEKDGKRFPLDSLSRELLRELLIFSVSQRSTFSTATSSSGSPPAVSTSSLSTASGSEEVVDAPSDEPQ